METTHKLKRRWQACQQVLISLLLAQVLISRVQSLDFENCNQYCKTTECVQVSGFANFEYGYSSSSSSSAQDSYVYIDTDCFNLLTIEGSTVTAGFDSWVAINNNYSANQESSYKIVRFNYLTQTNNEPSTSFSTNLKITNGSTELFNQSITVTFTGCADLDFNGGCSDSNTCASTAVTHHQYGHAAGDPTPQTYDLSSLIVLATSAASQSDCVQEINYSIYDSNKKDMPKPSNSKLQLAIGGSTLTSTIGDDSDSTDTIDYYIKATIKFNGNISDKRKYFKFTVSVKACQDTASANPGSDWTTFEQTSRTIQIGQISTVISVPTFKWGDQGCQTPATSKTLTLYDANDQVINDHATYGITLVDGSGTNPPTVTVETYNDKNQVYWTTLGGDSSQSLVFKVKLTETNSVANFNGPVATHEEIFEITYEDKCATAALSENPGWSSHIQDMQTSVLRTLDKSLYDSAVTGSIPDVQQAIKNHSFDDPNNWIGSFPKVNLYYSDNQKWRESICGPIEARMSTRLTQAQASFVTVNKRSGTKYYIENLPTSNDEIGENQTFQIEVYLANYEEVYVTKDFQVTVLPCQILSLTDNSIEDQEYKITDDPLDVNVKPYQFEPLCNYNLSFTLENVSHSPGISGDRDQFYFINDEASPFLSFQSLTLANRGVYVFTATLNITSYPTSSGNDVSIAQADATELTLNKTFKITLKDPCESEPTVLEPQFPDENGSMDTGTYATVRLHSIIGNGNYEYSYKDYPDEQSRLIDVDGSGYNLCFARVHEFYKTIFMSEGIPLTENTQSYGQTLAAKVGDPVGPETSNNYLQVLEITNSHDVKIQFGTSSNQFQGSNFLHLKVHLEEYPTIFDDQVQFELIFYKLVSDLSMQNVEYTLETDLMEISVPEAVFSPDLEDDPLTFDTDGSKVVNSIVGLPNALGSFDSQSRVIKIQSSDLALVGSHRILVYHHLQDYLEDQKPLVKQFYITVLDPNAQKKVYAVPIKPMFDLGTVESLAFELQVGEAWNFDLPQPADHDYQVVYDMVQLDKMRNFAQYDQSAMRINILANSTTESSVGNYTIQLRLVDENGVNSEVLSIQLSILSNSASGDQASDLGDYFASLISARIKKQQADALAAALLNKSLAQPKAEIKDVTKTGIVKVGFDKKMNVFADFSVNSDEQWVLYTSSSRMLDAEIPQQSDQSDSQKLNVDLLSVRVDPCDFNEENDMGVKWNMTSFTEFYFELELKFNKPELIASTNEKDYIVVTINSAEWLTDSTHFLPVDNSTLRLTKELPQQFDSDKLAKFEETKESVSKGAATLFGISGIGQFFLAASLQYLWEMIHAQQIVIILYLFAINLPENVKIVFRALMTIAAFEFLPTEDWYFSWFNSDPENGNPFSEKFEDLGMEHHLTMNNFGTLGFFVGLLFPLIMLYELINLFQGIKCCRKTARRLGKALFYSVVLRMLMESYVIGLLCTLINLKSLDFSMDDKWTFANAFITCVLFPILMIFPIFAILFMLGNWDELTYSHTQNRFGEMYEGFNLKTRKMVVYWGCEYLRKTLLCVAVILYAEIFFVQMCVLFTSSIMLIIAAGFIDARKSKYDKYMDIFNEVKLILLMYHLLLFTMFVPELETQEKVGLSCFFCLLIGIGINMIQLIVQPLLSAIKKLKLFCFKRRFRQRFRKSGQRLRLRLSAKNFRERRKQKYEELMREEQNKEALRLYLAANSKNARIRQMRREWLDENQRRIEEEAKFQRISELLQILKQQRIDRWLQNRMFMSAGYKYPMDSQFVEKTKTRPGADRLEILEAKVKRNEKLAFRREEAFLKDQLRELRRVCNQMKQQVKDKGGHWALPPERPEQIIFDRQNPLQFLRSKIEQVRQQIELQKDYAGQEVPPTITLDQQLVDGSKQEQLAGQEEVEESEDSSFELEVEKSLRAVQSAQKKETYNSSLNMTQLRRNRVLAGKRALITDKLPSDGQAQNYYNPDDYLLDSDQVEQDPQPSNPQLIAGNKQKPQPQLTFDDLNYFYENHGMNIGDISMVRGFEDFEVCESIPHRSFGRDLPSVYEDMKRISQKPSWIDHEDEEEKKAPKKAADKNQMLGSTVYDYASPNETEFVPQLNSMNILLPSKLKPQKFAKVHAFDEDELNAASVLKADQLTTLQNIGTTIMNKEEPHAVDAEEKRQFDSERIEFAFDASESKLQQKSIVSPVKLAVSPLLSANNLAASRTLAVDQKALSQKKKKILVKLNAKLSKARNE